MLRGQPRRPRYQSRQGRGKPPCAKKRAVAEIVLLCRVQRGVGRARGGLAYRVETVGVQAADRHQERHQEGALQAHRCAEHAGGRAQFVQAEGRTQRVVVVLGEQCGLVCAVLVGDEGLGGGALQTAEIDQVEAATRLQHAMRFRQATGQGGGVGQVVQRDGGYHCVDRRRGDALQRLHAPVVQLHVANRAALQGVPGQLQHGGGGVDTGEARRRIQPGDHRQLVGRAAAQVQHPSARRNDRAGLNGVVQIAEGEHAVLPPGLHEGLCARRVVHQQFGLGDARLPAARRQVEEEVEQQGGAGHGGQPVVARCGGRL